MDLLLNILFAIVAIVVVLFVLGLVLPDHQKVARETTINAPIDQVFGLISNLERWDQWSPWAKIDPDMKMNLSGEGVGQKMEWTSDHKNVGNGSQEILELVPNEKMRTRLEFGEMGGAFAQFDVEAVGEGQTKVVWSLDTKMREGVPFMKQPMATFFGFMMDKMVGSDYEKGLAALKSLAEGGAQA